MIESQADHHRFTVPFSKGPITLVIACSAPSSTQSQAEANIALEFHTASFLREPETPPDAGPTVRFAYSFVPRSTPGESRMAVKEVSARWLKVSKALKKEDQVFGQKLTEMAKKHSSEAFYALDDPLEAVVFSVLVEMMKELDEEKTHRINYSPQLTSTPFSFG